MDIAKKSYRRIQMIHSVTLILAFFLITGAAYSPKSQFDKTNHGKTLQQREVSPESVIGGAMGGELDTNEIQREEAEENSHQEFNCEEARKVCGPGFKGNNPEGL